MVGLGVMALTALSVGGVLAQPTNDNFGSATALDNGSTWNSIIGNNLGATPEPGEPFHAGFASGASVWYKWVAPQDGEVQMDTIGSSFDTVLGVYTGASVSTLSQVAANDDLFPTFALAGAGQTAQLNEMAQPTDNQNVPPEPFELVLLPGDVVPDLLFGEASYLIDQPYTGYPGVLFNGSGASGLRFNAKAGVTYYFAISSKIGSGPFALSWGYHSSGVFKFASESRDQTTGIPPRLALPGIQPGMLLYQVAESEEFAFRSGNVDAGQLNSTFHTVYDYETGGLLVTITRVGGSSGRVKIGYTTVDGDQIHDHYTYNTTNGTLIADGALIPLVADSPAVGGFDYEPVSGTLTFNDSEISKTIVIPVFDDGGIANHNRDFSVVLFNAHRDVSESALVSQPRLDPIDSQVLVRILDLDMDPRGPGQAL